MHWIDEMGIEKLNKRLVLSKVEELNLTEYELRRDSQKELNLNVWDRRYSTNAFASINLSKGFVEELETGAREGDFLFELDNYSPRIEELASIEKELHKYDRTRDQNVDGRYESHIP